MVTCIVLQAGHFITTFGWIVYEQLNQLFPVLAVLITTFGWIAYQQINQLLPAVAVLMDTQLYFFNIYLKKYISGKKIDKWSYFVVYLNRETKKIVWFSNYFFLKKKKPLGKLLLVRLGIYWLFCPWTGLVLRSTDALQFKWNGEKYFMVMIHPTGTKIWDEGIELKKEYFFKNKKKKEKKERFLKNLEGLLCPQGQGQFHLDYVTKMLEGYSKKP